MSRPRLIIPMDTSVDDGVLVEVQTGAQSILSDFEVIVIKGALGPITTLPPKPLGQQEVPTDE